LSITFAVERHHQIIKILVIRKMELNSIMRLAFGWWWMEGFGGLTIKIYI
jgi:hypothetical protein